MLWWKCYVAPFSFLMSQTKSMILGESGVHKVCGIYSQKLHQKGMPVRVQQCMAEGKEDPLINKLINKLQDFELQSSVYKVTKLYELVFQPLQK